MRKAREQQRTARRPRGGPWSSAMFLAPISAGSAFGVTHSLPSAALVGLVSAGSVWLVSSRRGHRGEQT